MSELIEYFQHPSDLINYITDAEYDESWEGERPSLEKGKDFAGTSSMDETIRLASNGWPDGLKKMVEKMNVNLSTGRSKLRLLDVAGDYPDIGAFLAGSPVCMTRRTITEGMKKPIIDIVMNGCFPAITETDAIMNYGAAMASMIDELESVGFSVNLQVSIVSDIRGNTSGALTTIKQAGEAMDLDRLVFYTANPSFFRRIMFAYWETKFNSGVLHGAAYGVATNPDKKYLPENCIYLGTNFSLNVDCKDPKTAYKYVRKCINEQRPDLLDQEIAA